MPPLGADSRLTYHGGVRPLAPALVLSALLLIVAVPELAIAGPIATASRSCEVGSGRGYGTTYLLTLSVRHTSCASGKDVVRAFHACRRGKAGRCSRRVLGYRCSERRFNKSRVSYDGRVTCEKGRRVVRHTYTQFV
jgi:hypothetical protein